MNKLTQAFIERSQFYKFNAERVDLNIQLVYNKKHHGDEEILLWNDHTGIILPFDAVIELREVLSSSQSKAVLYLLDSLVDTPDEVKNNPNHYIVIGYRKEALEQDLSTVQERLWYCDYETSDPYEDTIPKLLKHEGVLDVFNNPVNRTKE